MSDFMRQAEERMGRKRAGHLRGTKVSILFMVLIAVLGLLLLLFHIDRTGTPPSQEPSPQALTPLLLDIRLLQP